MMLDINPIFGSSHPTAAAAANLPPGHVVQPVAELELHRRSRTHGRGRRRLLDNQYPNSQ